MNLVVYKLGERCLISDGVRRVSLNPIVDGNGGGKLRVDYSDSSASRAARYFDIRDMNNPKTKVNGLYHHSEIESNLIWRFFPHFARRGAKGLLAEDAGKCASFLRESIPSLEDGLRGEVKKVVGILERVAKED